MMNENRKKPLMLVCFLIVLFFLYFRLGESFFVTDDMPCYAGPIPVPDGYALSQEISGRSGKLRSFTMPFTVYDEPADGVVTVSVLYNDKMIQTWEHEAKELTENPVNQTFVLNRPLHFHEADRITVTITAVYRSKSVLGVYVSRVSTEGLLKAGEKEVPGRRLNITLTLEDTAMRNTFFATASIFLLILFLLCVRHSGSASCRSIVFAALSTLVLSEITATVLLPGTVQTYRIKESYSGASFTEIASGKTYVASFTVDAPADRIEFFFGGPYGQERMLQVKLEHVETGTIFADLEMADENLIASNAGGVAAAKIDATAAGARIKRFSVGTYRLSIWNRGNDSLLLATDPQDSAVAETYQTIRSGFDAWIVLLVLLMLASYAIMVINHVGSLSPERFFVISAVPLMLCFLLLKTPSDIPDAKNHFLASYRFSNMVLGHDGEEEWSGRLDDVTYYQKEYDKPLFYAVSGMHFRAHSNTLTAFPEQAEHMTYYSAFSYLPQTVGLVLGRLLGLGSLLTVMLGRICMALTSIIVCYRAVKKTPLLKYAFALVPLFPRALWSLTSFSYDAMVLVAAIGFTSSILALRQDTHNHWCLAECMMWSFLLGAVKGGGYLILLVLVCLIIRQMHDLRTCAAVIAPGIVSVLVFDVFLTAGSSLFQFGEAGSGYLQTSFALRHPVRYMDMMIATYIREADFLFFSMIDVTDLRMRVIPGVILVAIVIVTWFLALSDIQPGAFRKQDRVVMLTTILLFFLTLPAMLLSYTPAYLRQIAGLLGRYYLPVLPVAFMLSGRGIVTREEVTSRQRVKALICFSALDIIGICYMMLKS